MVDARHFEQVECFADVVRRPLLAGMRDRPETLSPRPGEDVGEFRGRMTAFGRVEPHRYDFVAEWQGLLEGRHCRCLRLIAQETENQKSRQAIVRARIVQAGSNALHHSLEGNPTLSV